MQGDLILFLLGAAAFMAAFLALQAWSLGKQLRGEWPGRRGRPPEWAFSLPRAIAGLGWWPRVLGAALYVTGIAGLALSDAFGWALVGMAGLALGAWTTQAAVVVRVVEKNRAAMEALPPVNVRRRVAIGLAVSGAWVVAMVPLGYAFGWWRDQPTLLVVGLAVYGAALGVAGVVMLRRSRGATTAPPR